MLIAWTALMLVPDLPSSSLLPHGCEIVTLGGSSGFILVPNGLWSLLAAQGSDQGETDVLIGLPDSAHARLERQRRWLKADVFLSCDRRFLLVCARNPSGFSSPPTS